ncbi:transcription elongation factor GreA [[Mycoplasma] gypis]|uniref:Transcription elongation factor GreA n=1 Tax=[Mycoplasma] gypis TaxID=92404 RepID=A0ABZ2RNS1_9BACT|nr:transcription elongation factor GreA [[Mycoplasma] gypis]MBN0919467.1 transcription elongation factor GreA [[Mycoplasma] gypis]
MTDQNKLFLTQELLDSYTNELKYLLDVARPQVVEEIKEARGQGDLSENAEYDAARDKQSQIEARIQELQHILDNYELIDESGNNSVVTIGSTVTVMVKSTKKEKKFQVVGSLDADPFANKISNHSPLAKACLGKKVHDEVEVEAPNKYTIIIKKIS